MATKVIELGNLDVVIRSLDAFPKALEEESTKALRSALSQVGRVLAKYPNERPNQKYVRSGDLGRGWTNAKPMLSGRGAAMTGTLINVVSYADLVQGDDQAKIHKDRWQTAQAALDEAEEDIQGQLDGAVDTALRRVGLKGL